MLDDRIDRMDHASNREIDLPGDVIEILASADQMLDDQLTALRQLPLHASWCHFRKDPTLGWMVSLHLFTSEYSFGQEVRVENLRDPANAKEFVRSVFWEYAQTYSEKIGEQIRQIRSDLKVLIAAGRD